MKVILLIKLCLLFSVSSWSQTCCTAGPPLNAAVNAQIGDPGTFNVQMSYEYKSINALVQDDIRVQNDPRSRFGQSVLLKTDYVLNPKWAFIFSIPVVQQNRRTNSEKQSSLGIGDISLLVQRSIICFDKNLFFVIGAELPTGTTNHRSDSNVFLSPDMQSGSGTLDYIFGTGYQKSNFLKNGLTIDLNSIYKKNATNESFGSSGNFNGRSFAFGNELITQLNLSYLLVQSSGFFLPDAGIKFRTSSANKEQGSAAPNSGGTWWSLPFGVSYLPSEAIAYRVFMEFPIHQSLNGLQITSDFTVGLTFRMALNKNQQAININL